MRAKHRGSHRADVRGCALKQGSAARVRGSAAAAFASRTRAAVGRAASPASRAARIPRPSQLARTATASIHPGPHNLDRATSNITQIRLEMISLLCRGGQMDRV